MWHGHNREFILGADSEKHAYLSALCKSFTDAFKETIHFHGYCLMGTHSHEVGRVLQNQNSLRDGVKTLGDWMRNAHSRFGTGYNLRHNRRGKVAYDRPKTEEIKNEWDVLRELFYADANPVRAKMVSHPSHYRHSSYRFYAEGKSDEFTKHLTPPPAYLALGKTPAARRAKYRSLCDAYLRAAGLLNDKPNEEVPMTALDDFLKELYRIPIREGPG
jgi:putative transposase